MAIDNWQKAAAAWMVGSALVLAIAVRVGLPAWALILIAAACFLPIVVVGFWLVFDKGVRP